MPSSRSVVLPAAVEPSITITALKGRGKFAGWTRPGHKSVSLAPAIRLSIKNRALFPLRLHSTGGCRLISHRPYAFRAGGFSAFLSKRGCHALPPPGRLHLAFFCSLLVLFVFWLSVDRA